MLAPETETFVEAGPALLVGHGRGRADPGTRHRVPGLTILTPEPARSGCCSTPRTHRPAQTSSRRARLQSHRGDVPSLRALQMKGDVHDVTAGTDLDTERSGRYHDAFYSPRSNSRAHPPQSSERLAPSTLVACTVRVKRRCSIRHRPGRGRAHARAQRRADVERRRRPGSRPCFEGAIPAVIATRAV